MSKMKKCSTCGKEIASNANVCPDCGGKQKKPLLKKWWFWVIAIIVVIIAISSSGGNDENPNTTETTPNVVENIVYEEYTVAELVDDLEANALKAENKYLNKYVSISGKLSVIDSDGKYISLQPSNDPFSLVTVQCYMKNDEQKNFVMNLSKGDSVTVKGKIKHIGEILGYQMDITEFVE